MEFALAMAALTGICSIFNNQIKRTNFLRFIGFKWFAHFFLFHRFHPDRALDSSDPDQDSHSDKEEFSAYQIFYLK